MTVWQLPESASFSNLKNREKISPWAILRQLVARQLVLQKHEEQQVHKTVGNHETVARQLVLQQPDEQQVWAIRQCGSYQIACIKEPKIELQI
jgi:hypothetical protein